MDSKLVETGDAPAMAEAIRNIIEHPSEAVRLTKAARLKAESFDWQAVKIKWLELLA